MLTSNKPACALTSSRLLIQKLQKLISLHRLVTVWLLFAIATIVLTWPVFPNMATQITESRDPVLVASILGYGREHFLKGQFTQLYESNNSYPYTNTLTYTDHSFVLSLMGLPLGLFTDNLILIYNFVFLLSWFLTGLAGFYLVRYYTRSYWAGIVGGLVTAFNAVHYAQIGHLQTNTYQFIPFSMLFLDKFILEGGKRNALWFVFFCLLTVGMSFYYVAYLVVALAVIVTFRFLVSGELRNWKKLVILAVCAVPIGLLTLALSLPYLKFSEEQNLVRTINNAIYNSATIAHYFTAEPGNLLYGASGTHRVATEPYFSAPEHSLFLGFGLYLLAVVGFFARRSQPRILSKTQLMYLVMVGIAFVLTFGPYLVKDKDEIVVVNGNPVTLPYKFLYDNIVLFQGIRVPTRFMTVMVIALAVLAGIGAQRLWNARLKYGKVFSLSLALILLVESLSWPVTVKPLIYPYDDTYDFIARQPGTDWSVFEFPTSFGNTSIDAENYVDSEYYTVFHSVQFNKKTLNGYSAPDTTERLNKFLTTGLADQSDLAVELLAGVKVKYLIIRADRLPDRVFREKLLARLAENPYSKIVFQKEASYVYQLSPREELSGSDPAISISYKGLSFDRENLPSVRLEFSNKTSKLWVNPQLEKYRVEIKVDGITTVKQPLKPLYLLPGETFQQEMRFSAPSSWNKQPDTVTVRIDSQ